MKTKFLGSFLVMVCWGQTLANTSTGAGATIDWSCVSLNNHQTSTNAAWDESFIFQLGVFEAGFTPTAMNRAQWAQNWRLAQAARYISDTRYTVSASVRVFSNSYCFSNNDAPFTTGRQGFIWGVGGREGTEWILLTQSAWTWPAVTFPALPFGSTWLADGSVQTVGAGTVVTSGSTYFYRSASVTDSAVPALPWEAWRSLHFTTSELTNNTLSGAGADPDSDGWKNIDEYAQMTWPRLAFSGRPWPTEAFTTMIGGSNHLSLRLRYDPRARLTLTAQRSTNLITWESAASATTLIESNAGKYTVRESATTGGAQRFLRAVSAP